MIKISTNRSSLILVVVALICLLASGLVGASNVTFKAVNLDAQSLRDYGYTPIALEFGFPIMNRLDGVFGVGFSHYNYSTTYSDTPESNSSDSQTAGVYSLGLRYYFPMGKSFEPFVFGNIGVINVEGESRFNSIQPQGITLLVRPGIYIDPSLQYQYNVGLGAKLPVAGDWSLVGEAGLKARTLKRVNESNGSVNEGTASVFYSALGVRFDF